MCIVNPASGGSFSYNDYNYTNTNTNVGSQLCKHRNTNPSNKLKKYFIKKSIKMKDFKQLNINPVGKNFSGTKIKMSKVLNREIIIHDFKIEDSKIFKDNNSKCLHLQIELNEVKYIIFTSSNGLIDSIKQTVPGDFPFTTTIIEENDRYLFS